MQRTAVISMICASALAACGGGGEGASPPAPAPITVFPVDSVVTRLAISGGAFAVANVDATGKQTRLAVDYVPGASGWFSRRQTLTPAGAVGVTTQESVNFSRTGTLFKVIGWIDSTSDTAVIQESVALPATGSVGTSGTLANGSIVIQNNGINTVDIGLTHALSYTWALTAATDTTADLCLTARDSGDFYAKFATDCFRIDAVGTISGFKSLLGYHAKGIDGQTVYQ